MASNLERCSWHGTVDAILYYPNLGEELKEWSNVLNVAFSHNVTNTPSSGYTEIVYGDGTQLIGYSAVGVGHTVPVHETIDLAWFCISAACAGGTTTSVSGSTTTSSKSATTLSTTTSAPATTTSTTTGGGTVAKWGQW
jgi:acetylxylan esterase